MIIYLPCKLGLSFVPKKFKDWVDGKRVYEDANCKVNLDGFFAMDFGDNSCLSIPNIFTNSGFYSYDPKGEFGQEFVPRYKINLDVTTEKPLCDFGFPGKRKARVCGLVINEGILCVDFVTRDRHEHLYYPIKNNIDYALLDKEPKPIKLIHNKDAKEESLQISLFDL